MTRLLARQFLREIGKAQFSIDLICGLSRSKPVSQLPLLLLLLIDRLNILLRTVSRLIAPNKQQSTHNGGWQEF